MMWSIFKPLAKFLDPAPDDVLEEWMGPKYGASLGVLGFILLCLISLMLFLGYTWYRGATFQPVIYRTYQATAEKDKRVGSLPSLRSPIYSTSRIQSWGAKVISETLSFNFRNVDERIGAADSFYTKAAAASMRASIEKNNLAAQVVSNRLDVTVTPLFAPRVVDYLIINGVKTWIVEAPILLTYASSSKSDTRTLMVKLKIREADPALYADGLLVSAFFTSGYTY